MGDLSELAGKAQAFLELHHGAGPLIIANAWDASSARVFEAEGFHAIGTSSAGIAFCHGYADGQHIQREEMISAVRRIAATVRVPVTADVEAGYGPAVEDAVETARLVLSAGAVGLNIEDLAGEDETTLVDVGLQSEKIRAIRNTADSFKVHLVINARTDIFWKDFGEPATRFDRAVERLRAYARAGADCLFAPGLRDPETIRGLVQALPKPLNILAGAGAPPVSELRRLGVARISIGSGAMRATMGLVQRIARELLDRGEYSTMLEGAIPYNDANRLMHRGAESPGLLE